MFSTENLPGLKRKASGRSRPPLRQKQTPPISSPRQSNFLHAFGSANGPNASSPVGHQSASSFQGSTQTSSLANQQMASDQRQFGTSTFGSQQATHQTAAKEPAMDRQIERGRTTSNVSPCFCIEHSGWVRTVGDEVLTAGRNIILPHQKSWRVKLAIIELQCLGINKPLLGILQPALSTACSSVNDIDE